MHFRPFEQIAAVAQRLELLFGDEHIMDAVDLARTPCPRRHRDRQSQIELLGLQQHARQGRLASPGWGRKNQHQAAPAKRRFSRGPRVVFHNSFSSGMSFLLDVLDLFAELLDLDAQFETERRQARIV